jgi:hypothetical protein
MWNVTATSLRAWILDLYPGNEGMVLWLKAEDGRALRAVDRFPMTFFLAGEGPDLRAAWKELAGWKKGLRLARERRFEIHLGEEIDLLAVTAPDPIAYRAAVREALKRWPPGAGDGTGLSFYNADLDPAIVYGIERGVFPLADCRFTLERERVLGVETDQTRWDLDAAPPPFCVLTLRLAGELRDPSRGYRAPLEIASPAGNRSLAWDSPRELVQTVRETLLAADPDVLLTAWGDSFLLPELLRLSSEQRIDLPLNRDARRDVLRKGERSYFSYGRIVHRASSVWLFGRLHIDRQTAFLADEYGLDGLVELARTTLQPLQQVARTSSGTGMADPLPQTPAGGFQDRARTRAGRQGRAHLPARAGPLRARARAGFRLDVPQPDGEVQPLGRDGGQGVPQVRIFQHRGGAGDRLSGVPVPQRDRPAHTRAAPDQAARAQAGGARAARRARARSAPEAAGGTQMAAGHLLRVPGLQERALRADRGA